MSVGRSDLFAAVPMLLASSFCSSNARGDVYELQALLESSDKSPTATFLHDRTEISCNKQALFLLASLQDMSECNTLLNKKSQESGLHGKA